MKVINDEVVAIVLNLKDKGIRIMFLKKIVPGIIPATPAM